ncbi:unnamed protein product [Rotaria sp. Silwood1]|nr:unnamed protein product [Rotaria sp. Silwood1]
MAFQPDSPNNQFQFNNIYRLLITKLETKRQQSPESFSKSIYILPAINDDMEHQLEQELEQERKEHMGQRIILIPYCLAESYWIGILIEFEANEQILRAEYIDPVIGSDIIPDSLKNQITKVYPFAVLRSRDLSKHNERKFSETLTVENLLEAVKYDLFAFPADPELKIRELTEKLNSGLAKHKLHNMDQLQQEIKDLEERIQRLHQQGRQEKAEEEMELLRELQELAGLSDKINELTSSVTFSPSPHINEPFMQEPPRKPSLSTDIMHLDERTKTLSDITELLDEANAMPPCARKTTIELIIYFEQRLLEEKSPSPHAETLVSSLDKLQDQLKQEELFSENASEILHHLKLHVTSSNYALMVSRLKELLEKIRPLNVGEIQRLVLKAKKAADSIRNKDIILLVGVTGSGKSTTIQFLSGATMKEVRVETSPGKYLEHITAVGPMQNPELNYITSSPLQKSETRYIAPVTVQLKGLLGAHESGEMIFCDAPGFEDTAGPEVDIANSIGVIGALKQTKSVKLLALSSFKSIGDRGQGIQKLAHILISMMHGIEDKLDAIFYAFTKYPEKTDINALLCNIKKETVDKDVILKNDRVFVEVLIDMIDKTEDGAFKIEPTRDNPKYLIKKLKTLRCIRNPEEVFQFSMSTETRACLEDHVQRDRFGIICATKHKNNLLILYYLNDLKKLNELINENFIREAYKESIRFVSESISEYCKDITKNFNRALCSQDGLQEKDIFDYQTSIKYIEEAKILKEHLGSYLTSPAALIQNIVTELNRINDKLDQEDLNSPLVTTYLDNFCMLKSSFIELEESYRNSCRKFVKRFDELVQTAHELIPKTDFKQIAEVLLNICQSVQALKKHFPSRLHEIYDDIVKGLLQHLKKLSETVEPLLAKVRLNNEEVEVIKKLTETLRSAKENAALQERVSTYLEYLKKKTHVLDEHDIKQTFGKNNKSLNEIYDEFIAKVIKHFDEISLIIKESFDRNGDNALEYIKRLVSDMDSLRTIPELETRTAGTYYRTIESVRSHMQQLQEEAEKLIIAIDQQSGITNHRNLARSLSRLKNAEWINQISPGTYDSLMRRITEELVQYVCQLEDSFMKIDFGLKYPENVSAAEEIVKKIQSMHDLEQSVPELKPYTEKILQRFLHCTQEAFDRIQKTFNLQDKEVYKVKQKLIELEEIKREYNDLHPAPIYLQNQGYPNINILSKEIEELKNKKKQEIEALKVAQHNMESELQQLNSVVQQYGNLSSPSTEQGILQTLSSRMTSDFQNEKLKAETYLKSLGYSSIESVYEKILNINQRHRQKSQRIEEQNTELSILLDRLESIRKEHDSLTNGRHSSSEQASFLQKKGFDSYELLDKSIQEEERILNERGKNQQSYYFNDRLDASTANNALVYIRQCEKVSHDRVKENVIDANENLRRYIREYGIFLKQEIDMKFKYICDIENKRDPFFYSQDLEIRLQELSSFNKFPHVFECTNGAEMIGDLQQKFLNYHRNLSSQMETHKNDPKIEELRVRVDIAQALTCVDRFCVNIFAGNDFAVLYTQYQGEMHKKCRIAYKAVLDHISKGDYTQADIALSDIQDNPLNPRDKAQIQHDLYCSLNKLMKATKSITNWLDGKIEREDTRNQITEIRENIEKTQIACNKHRIMELLDEKVQIDLKNFDNEINEILSRIILKGLKSIEAFMDADSFSEAEQGMENLGKVQRELSGCCVSSDVTKKSEELEERLGQIVNEILNRSDFEDVSKYSINPPKDLLAKLKMVATHGSARYVQAHNSMVDKIRKTFSLAIDQAHKAPLNECSLKIRSLNYALCFLPEDLQAQFKSQIDELSKLIAEKVAAYKQDLERSFTNVDEDEHTITKLGSLAEKYSKENMQDLLKALREQCLKQLHIYQMNVQRFFDEKNIQSAVNTIKKILKYDESVGAYISETTSICNNVRDLTIKRMSNCCDTLANICLVEQTQIIEKAFSDMLIFLDFSNTSDERIEKFFPDEVLQNIQEVFQRIYDYLNKNSETFRIVLKDMNILELHKVMLTSKKWQKFLEQFIQCQMNYSLLKKISKEMTNIISYVDMISHLEQIINHLTSQINVEFITRETTIYETKREELFQNLMNAITKLRKININFKNMLSSPINIDTYETQIKTKVDNIKRQLLAKASRDELSTKDTDDFRTYYYHLLSFEKNVRLPGIDIRQILDESQEKISIKVDSLKKEITRSILNAVAVSTALIKIKFYAENLSMFEKHINDEIDNALKSYKLSQGTAGITRLSIELEKTDIGARLISEHSTLSGEDWRKRREKIQKQDDLEYILQNLTGDDLAKNILRSRYKTYRDKYDQLLSTFLSTIKQNDNTEPDLEVLVTQTKLIVGTVKQTSDSVTWDRSFKENIPELVAHISAIWTLKNTQHYNAMRGIDEAHTYLLMPHVGQIIAIFRLLGLGYEKNEKISVVKIPYKKIISDALVNNLVEVGTGEGKSVVLAITACVFALTGVDVNCSCYSEVLSSRDKNDFISVFRTLGIEDRIEYGTFNKLCEQLLNEQCNIREKVRDVIIANQNSLPVVDTLARIRPKVLLIDEVDVFLSDKYYGGMYIPSVYLKHPSITVLLDSIWNNKTLKSLNSVKALPSYTTCATQFSN